MDQLILSCNWTMPRNMCFMSTLSSRGLNLNKCPPIIPLETNTLDPNDNHECPQCYKNFHHPALDLSIFHSYWALDENHESGPYKMMIQHISSTYLWQLCTTLSTPVCRSLMICRYRQTSLKQFYTRQLLRNKAIVWWSIWQSFNIIKLLATFEIPYQLDHPLQQP